MFALFEVRQWSQQRHARISHGHSFGLGQATRGREVAIIDSSGLRGEWLLLDVAPHQGPAEVNSNEHDVVQALHQGIQNRPREEIDTTNICKHYKKNTTLATNI